MQISAAPACGHRHYHCPLAHVNFKCAPCSARDRFFCCSLGFWFTSGPEWIKLPAAKDAGSVGSSWTAERDPFIWHFYLHFFHISTDCIINNNECECVATKRAWTEPKINIQHYSQSEFRRTNMLPQTFWPGHRGWPRGRGPTNAIKRIKTKSLTSGQKC